MIAVDTSSAIAYLDGERAEDVDRIEREMTARRLRLPPTVITELMSSPRHGPRLRLFIEQLPILPIKDGYWERVGDARALLFSKGLKARLADALIAQCCIDTEMELITRDRDFRHFERFCGLKLAV